MPALLPREICERITTDIRTGVLGRDAIARKHDVSPGVVTKIARTHRLTSRTTG